jgi:predicted membrane protein
MGLFVGVKHRFRNNAWWIMIFIGTIFLIPPFHFMGVSSTELVWPAAFIVGGLCIALKPTKKKMQYIEKLQANTTTDNFLNVDVTFGGRKEIVTSKDFRGGNVSTAFAGSEINLMQADSTVQPMELNIKVTFGGVELIVPSHWDVIVEIQPSFGSVEDHRMVRTPVAGEEKRTLILRGSVSFGSVEIKSY